MESLYKAALRNIYKSKLTKTSPKDYRDHLFSTGWSYREYPDPSGVVSPRPMASNIKSIENEALEEKSVDGAEVKTEKKKVIESLKDFSQNLLNESNSDSLKMDKVEISIKNSNFAFEIPEPLSTELVEKYTSKLAMKARYQLSSKNKLDINRMKVIFVADTLIDKFDDSTSISVNELPLTELTEFEALFDESTALLFSKMVKAMKVDCQDYLLTAISFGKPDQIEKQDCLDLVLSEIYKFKPSLVISLGVSASHALIDTKQRLKDLHGNFYPLNIGDLSTEVMPLFSPSLLNSAPHMKSITWKDMQKAMERLSL